MNTKWSIDNLLTSTTDLVQVLGPRPYPVTDATVKAFLEGASEAEKQEETVPEVDQGTELTAKPEWVSSTSGAPESSKTDNTNTAAETKKNDTPYPSTSN